MSSRFLHRFQLAGLALAAIILGSAIGGPALAARYFAPPQNTAANQAEKYLQEAYADLQSIKCCYQSNKDAETAIRRAEADIRTEMRPGICNDKRDCR